MKNRLLVLVIISILAFSLISCGNEKVEEPINEPISTTEQNIEVVESEIEETADLSEYLNKEKVMDALIAEPSGATSPFMPYANDNYAVIITHKGTLIFNIADGLIDNAIDGSGTNLNRTMGDGTTVALGNGGSVLLFNEGYPGKENSSDHYIYTFEPETLVKGSESHEADFSMAESAPPEFDAQIKNLVEIKDNQEYNALETDKNIVVFKSDYNDVKEWKLYLIDKNNDAFIEMFVFPEESLSFTPDDSLDKYLDVEKVSKGISDMPFGATAATLDYANDDFAIISHHAGNIVFDLKNDEIHDAIDASLGMTKMQGSEITVIRGNEDKIILYNEELSDENTIDENNIYIYSFNESKLGKATKEDIINFGFANRETWEYEALITEVVGETDDYSVIKTDKNLVILRTDNNDEKEWKIYTVDLSSKEVKEMDIFK